MALSDILRFENPVVVTVVIGLLVFVLAYSALIRFFQEENKKIAVVTSFILGVISTWYLYRNNYVENQYLIQIVFVLIALVVLSKIIVPFFKQFSRRR